MTNTEYQEFVKELAMYRDTVSELNSHDFVRIKKMLNISYAAMELADEAGEVLGKAKRIIRGDYEMDVLREQIIPELGDVLFPLTCLCEEFGVTLDDVRDMNVEKLSKRKENNTIKGQGDDR